MMVQSKLSLISMPFTFFLPWPLESGTSGYSADMDSGILIGQLKADMVPTFFMFAKW